LNPSYATAHSRYSQYLSFRERFEEALREARRAEELDPFSVVIKKNIAFVFYWARRYDEALEQYRKALEMEPTFPQALREIGLVYEQKRMHPEAIAALQKVIGTPGDYLRTTNTADLGHVYAVSGNKHEARKILNTLQEVSKTRYVPPFDVAVIYAGLGETTQALDWLERAYDDRSFSWSGSTSIRDLTIFAPEPRFRALVQRIGLGTRLEFSNDWMIRS
jgi:tetratricopeptide (TPR) repeat protein